MSSHSMTISMTYLFSMAWLLLIHGRPVLAEVMRSQASHKHTHTHTLDIDSSGQVHAEGVNNCRGTDPTVCETTCKTGNETDCPKCSLCSDDTTCVKNPGTCPAPVSVGQITCCAAEDTFNDGSPAQKEGREYDKAWDGSTATYYDAKKGNGYTGADLKGAYVITAIKYFWRKGGKTIQARQDNGKFQASNDKSTWTDLAQTSSSQGAGWVELANITDETAYRYIRFKGADGSYVNVAEIALFGYPAAKGNATKYAGEKKDGKDKAATDKVAMAAKAAKPVADAVAAVANAAVEKAVYQAALAGARAALGGKADKYGKKAKGMKEGSKTKEGNKTSKKDEDKADEAGANETVDEEQTDE